MGIPSGLFKRGSKLALAATKLAAHQVGSGLKTWQDEKQKIEAQVEAMRSFVATLSELKGASMKLGQLMSLDLGDFLPPQVLKVLETLHFKASPLPYPEIHEILQKEFGDKLKLLSNISEAPLATASIGQVHTAYYEGRRIVLKIQYPGVAESIPQDVKILRTLLTQLGRIQGKDIDFSELINEVHEVLEREADYEHELRMLQTYAKNFEGQAYVIPRAIPELSTSSVLSMDYIEGLPLLDWIETASFDQRKKTAHDFLNLYMQEFFKYGLVQTDPNPGNFLMTRQNRLGLLDFGAVKKYHQSFVAGYREVVSSSVKGRDDLVLEKSYELGFIDKREDDKIKESYLSLMKLVTRVFASREPMNFSDKTFLELTHQYSWELIKGCRYSPPPRDIIFLHRKLGGVFSIVRRLNVEVIPGEYWEAVIQKED